MMRFYAIDDELTALRTLESYILQIDGVCYIGGEQDSLKAKEYLINAAPLPDVVFLDLEMGGVNGDELARLLKGLSMVVFTTGHADFAVQSYEYNAVDYLLKPFSFERFKEAIEKCRHLYLLGQKGIDNIADVVLIKDSLTNKQVFVPVKKVHCIQANGNYCKIFMESGEYFMPLTSLVKTYESLQSDRFLQVHKSWVIHIDSVESFNSDYITLKNGTKIKLSRTYKRIFRKWIASNK